MAEDDRTGSPSRGETNLATTLEPTSDGAHGRASGVAGALAPGTRIDHFVVLEPIGAGGMGVVVAAYDTRLDRRVALKLLRPGEPGRSAGHAGQLRLLREAQAMARLAHPNVVVVHEVGTFADQVYVAMEYVEGETLARWSARRPRGWRAVIDVVGQAGRGLAAAHQAGLIHRDFKPANVLVGADGRVRVTDFGLVATTEAEPDPGGTGGDDAAPLHVTLTGAGALMGTPRYMAPEQHDRRSLTAAADQFAFCVTLYEALYREHPFDGSSYGELVENIAAGHLRPPPRDSAVPSWVRDVVVRGLRVDPAARHPSMAALLSALGRDPRALRRLQLWTVGVVAAVATGAAVALLVTGGSGEAAAPAPAPASPCAGAEAHLRGVWDGEVADAVTRSFTATPRRYAAATAASVRARLDRYAEQLTAMRTEACQATRVRGEQSDELLDLRMGCLDRHTGRLAALTALFAAGPDPAVVDNAMGAVDALPEVADCADLDWLRAAYPPPAGAQARAQVEALHARLDQATAAYTAGKYQAARAIAVEVTEAARSLDHPPLLADALWHLGNGHQTAGELDQAAAAFSDAARVAATAHDDPRVAESLVALFYVVGAEQSRPAKALTLLPAIEAAVARAGDPPLLSARMHEYQADVYALAEDAAAARRHLEQARVLYEQVKGPDHERVAQVLDSMALLAIGAGKFDEADGYHRRALAILERNLGAQHPSVARALYHVGSSLHEVGRYQEARAHYQRALDIDQAAFGPDHPNLAYTHNALGELLHTLGDERAARQHLEAALALWEKSLGPDHPLLSFPLRNLGQVLDASGEPDAAMPLYQRALTISEQALGPEHGDVAEVLYAMAQHHLLAGQLDPSRRLHQRALDIWQRQGPDHPYVAFGLTGLGEVELAAGRPARAVAPLERALAIRSAAPGDATDLGRTRFALARALWDSGRDRARAVTLARAARDDWATAGPRSHDRRAAIAAWLRDHAR